MARSWRIERKPKTQGIYYVLVAGRARDRVSISLKYVNDADAMQALATVQAEEDAGTLSRILALHLENPDVAVRYLCGDPGIAELLPEPAVDYGAMTLREYYTEVYAPWRAEDRPKSWRTEERNWTRILRELGATKVRKIDAHVVADYLDAMLIEREVGRQGEPVSGTTKRLHRHAIQMLLMRAERQRHIVSAPNLSRYRLRGSTKLVKARPVPLSLEEVVKLLDASGPKHRAMWAVGIGEGLRPSELKRLRWEHVHWDERVLDVPGEKTEDSAATIPLTPLAHRELRAWWMKQGQPAAGVLFPTRSRRVKAYTDASGYKRSLATAARKAGIERTVTPYLLRSSFATLAWSLGVDKDTARRVLRHTDFSMLDEVYCRPRPAELVTKVAAFDLSPSPKGEP